MPEKAPVPVLILQLLLFPAMLLATDPLPDIATFSGGMEKSEGYFTLYWNPDTAELWLEVQPEQWEREFLHMVSLPRGIGSNDIGIDRGQIRSSRIVILKRIGRKAMLIAPNYGYRAELGGATEKQSVEEAFAHSVICSMTIVAESEDGRVLINPNSFLTGDHASVADQLQATGQGSYQPDTDRSAIFKENTKTFPHNTEMEVILTFSGKPQSQEIQSVAPDAQSVSVHQRHSFVVLPDEGYKRRAQDPRSGYHGIRYQDYSTPIDQPLVRQFISRHRLQKKDPSAEKSEAVEPIIYYVDSGAPEPVRSALIEGARWWNDAFEAAGFIDAFQVQVLPEGADPMDVRYNVIQWVHRSTRGWSYGNSIVDPRTGEIIKGHVSLGSLRVRQDYLIATALTSPYEDGENAPAALREMALARIRQLSAHEVGHTLGLTHNFASSVNNRASVMDYPHPLVRLTGDGSMDFSEAYDVGIGEWDMLAIRYGYSDFPAGADERAELRTILREGYGEQGLLYIADIDARSNASLSPVGNLWDNGADPAAELLRSLEVRDAGLKRFGLGAIRNGVPYSELEKVLVPLYYFHRYQTRAAVKKIGGMYYQYAVRGEDEWGAGQWVPAEEQRTALRAMLETLKAERLTLPGETLELLLPGAPGFGPTQESMPGSTGAAFDMVAAGEAAAAATLDLLLDPRRANRLMQQHAADPDQLSLEEILGALHARLYEVEYEGLAGAVHAEIRWTALRATMRLARSSAAHDHTRAVVEGELVRLLNLFTVDSPTGLSYELRDFYDAAYREIRRFLDNPDDYTMPPAAPLPPGSPIGMQCGGPGMHS